MSANCKNLSPLRAIRKHCQDCGGSANVVKFCTCDGVNSTRCDLWPYRFGKRPETAAKKYGQWALDPRQMPPASVSQEDAQRQGVSLVAPDRDRAPEATREAIGATHGPITGAEGPER